MQALMLEEAALATQEDDSDDNGSSTSSPAKGKKEADAVNVIPTQQDLRDYT